MSPYTLQVELCSETTFGRGAGEMVTVDQEVQHDAIGQPYWSGRAIKGILVNECAEILASLGGLDAPAQWVQAAAGLFGKPGSTLEYQGKLHIGEAHLPNPLRDFLAWQLEARIAKMISPEAGPEEKYATAEQQRALFRSELLQCLTSTRSQTALDEDGTARNHTLRSQRVLIPGLIFEADLVFDSPPQPVEKGLLAACVMAMRASGSGRNRGKGAIQATLRENGQDITGIWFQLFKEERKQG